MNKKSVLLIVAVVLAAGGLFWLGKPSPSDNSSAEQASHSSADGSGQTNLVSTISEVFGADETLFDFGTISMAAGKVTHDFKVKNTSAEPVITEKLYSSCMCTDAIFVQNGKSSGPFGMPGHGFTPPLKKSIASGEEVVISVTFDPAAHGPAGVGKIERVVRLETKDKGALELEIMANVTP